MKTEHKVIAVSIIFGLIFWVTDAALDYVIFYKGQKNTFLDLLIWQIPAYGIYTRSIVLALFAALGLVISRVMVHRRRAGEELVQGEEKFRLLYQKAPLAYHSLDENGRLLDVNEAWLRLTGYSRPKVLGRFYNDIIHPDWRGHCKECFSRFQANGEVRGVEFEMLKEDGSALRVSLEGSTGYDRQGNFKQTHCILYDITESKQAEEALKQSEEQYRALADNLPVGLYRNTPGPQGKFLFANPAMARMFGFESEEAVLNIPVAELYADPAQRKALSDRIASHGRVQAQELLLKKKDGEFFWGAVTAGAVKSQSGDIQYFEGVIEDISERKRAEEERRRRVFYLENMARIHRVISRTGNLEQTMNRVLETVLSVFGCDRAWLLHPCDPEAPSWRVPFELTRPEYPGVMDGEEIVPMAPDARELFQAQLASSGPLASGPGNGRPLEKTAQRYGVQSQMCTVLHPKLGKPWILGMHQCSHPRVWSDQEHELFQDIAHRVSDALTSLLLFRDLEESEVLHREQRDLLNNAIESLTHPFYVIDAETYQIDLANSAAQITASPGSRTCHALTHGREEPCDGIEHPCPVKMVKKTRQPVTVEHVHYDRDGRPIYLELNAYPLLDAEGNVVQVIEYGLDITARKHAEEALRKSEQRYRTVMEASLQGTYRVDAKGRITFANPSTAELTGYSLAELDGLSLDALYPPGEAKSISDANMARLYCGKPIAGENTLTRKDDSRIETHFSCAPVLDESGEYMGFVGSILDITERKRAEDALRDSEEQFRFLAEGMTDIIWTVDLNFQTTYVSPSVEKMLGFSPEERKRQSMEEMVTPDSIQRIQETFARELPLDAVSADPDRSLKMEVEYYRKDGSTIWVENVVRAIRDSGGEIVGLHGVSRDITERRQAEEELRHEQRRLQAILEASPDPVVVYDSGGNTTYLNPAFTRVFGWTLGDVEGGRIPFVPDDQTSKTFATIRQLFDHGRPVSLETERTTKAGAVLDIYISLAGIKDATGEVVGMVVNLTDITTRKKLEAQLRQSQKMEAMGTLAGGIAHDFNNILTAIVGYGELAQLAARQGRDTAAHLDQIAQSADRARDLVKQILTFSRRSETDFKPLDLNQLVPHSVKMLEHAIPKMVDIQMKLAGTLDYIRGDSTQLEQVIMNLASNASDAMPEGGRLVFETSSVSVDHEFSLYHLEITPGNYVVLTITDTGQGMDKETLNNIFDPFFTTKEIGKGTGLGLSTAYGIVKEHGGHITCYSEPGQGTTFRIYLPAHQAGQEAIETKEPSRQIALGGQETLLLVDDEEAIRELGAELLEGAGYQVIRAANGEEALESYRSAQGKVELVILDLGMPGMGGHKCLKELLAVNPNLKVLIASGYSVSGKVKDTLRKGAAGYIAKPFRLNDLLHTVRSVLDA